MLKALNFLGQRRKLRTKESRGEGLITERHSVIILYLQ